MQLTLIEQTAQIAAALGHGWAQQASILIPEISPVAAAEYAACLYISSDQEDRPEVNTRYTLPGGITLAEAFKVGPDGWQWDHATGTGRLRAHARANHDDSLQHVSIEVHRPDRIVGGLGGSICVLRGDARDFQKLVEYVLERDVTVSGPDWEVSSLAEPRHHMAVLDALRNIIPEAPPPPDPSEVYVDKEMLAAFGVLDDPALEVSTSESQEE